MNDDARPTAGPRNGVRASDDRRPHAVQRYRHGLAREDVLAFYRRAAPPRGWTVPTDRRGSDPGTADELCLTRQASAGLWHRLVVWIPQGDVQTYAVEVSAHGDGEGLC